MKFEARKPLAITNYKGTKVRPAIFKIYYTQRWFWDFCGRS
jgi:hypothetical protein